MVKWAWTSGVWKILVHRKNMSKFTRRTKHSFSFPVGKKSPNIKRPISKGIDLTLFINFSTNIVQQECIPVGCVPPACCPYLPACTARGVYLPAPEGGVPGLGGTCLVPGGVPAWFVGGCTWSGGVPAWSQGGVPGPRGTCLVWGCTFLVGGYLPGPRGCTCLVPGGYLVCRVPAWSQGGVPGPRGYLVCRVPAWSQGDVPGPRGYLVCRVPAWSQGGVPGPRGTCLVWGCTLLWYRVPTWTGKPGKPGKMGRHFPVREKSGNYEQTGKVREKSGKITQNTGKLQGKVRENHTKNTGKHQGIWHKYYLIFCDL